MSTYHPPEHIVKIAALFSGEPIAHFERADGTIVIVMRDGRKMIFPPPAAHSQPPPQADAGEPVKARRPAGRKAKKP